MSKKKNRKGSKAAATTQRNDATPDRTGTHPVTKDAAPKAAAPTHDPSILLSQIIEDIPVPLPSTPSRAGAKPPPPPPGASRASSIDTRSVSVRGFATASTARGPAVPDDTEQVVRELSELARARGEVRFNDQRKVALGGVGAVTSVVDRALRRRFAAKTILDSARGTPMLVRSFLREAQITAGLEHPNIIPIHDIGTEGDGRLFFTMKLVQGRTLQRIIDDNADDRDARLTAVLDALFRVCDALSYAHARGVVHCDIKPDNVMVGDFGQVYLMDWGFAVVNDKKDKLGRSQGYEPIRPLPVAAMPGMIFGTPAYMAPEQANARHGDIDERTDVFALGAVIYHALAGKPPYRGDELHKTVMMAQQAAYPRLDSPEALGESCPPEIVRIVHRAMAVEREQRYPTVQELRKDLEHFVRGGANFPTLRVAKGDHVLREGDKADAAYIVSSGAIEVYKTIDGKNVKIGQLGPGDTFGEMALLAPAPRAASAVAVEDSVLVVITRDTVDQEMSTMKPWMGVFVRTLTRRFRDFQEAAVKNQQKKSWWQLW